MDRLSKKTIKEDLSVHEINSYEKVIRVKNNEIDYYKGQITRYCVAAIMAVSGFVLALIGFVCAMAGR